jgi:predicted transcriptional regulator
MPTRPVAAEVRPAEETEQQVVARVKQALETADKSSWAVADGWLALSKREWTGRRIAQEFGCSESRVSKYLACARKFSLGKTRPSFWEAYQTVNSVTVKVVKTETEPAAPRTATDVVRSNTVNVPDATEATTKADDEAPADGNGGDAGDGDPEILPMQGAARQTPTTGTKPTPMDKWPPLRDPVPPAVPEGCNPEGGGSTGPTGGKSGGGGGKAGTKRRRRRASAGGTGSRGGRRRNPYDDDDDKGDLSYYRQEISEEDIGMSGTILLRKIEYLFAEKYSLTIAEIAKRLGITEGRAFGGVKRLAWLGAGLWRERIKPKDGRKPFTTYKLDSGFVFGINATYRRIEEGRRRKAAEAAAPEEPGE